jgi:hypothetical protein
MTFSFCLYGEELVPVTVLGFYSSTEAGYLHS